MQDVKVVPARRVRREIETRRSRFIATVAPAFSVEEARDFIRSVRAEFAEATHNVPAYLIGHGPAVTAHCNDDGEPSGTAGRPVLSVLKGSGLGDVAAVVTRFYGGVKLGTGGLLRAYSEAVRQALDGLPRAQKAATHTVQVGLPYPFYQPFRQSLAETRAEVLREDFSDSVTLRLRLPVDDFETFRNRLGELSSGSASAEIIETDPNSILPVRPEEC